jgi:hypothetical protein
MSDSESTPAERAQLGFRDEVTGSRAAVGLVFVWVIFGAYNIDLVQAIHDGSGSDVAFYPGGGWAIARLASSIVLIAASWPLKRFIEKADGEGRRFWGWWWSGAAIIVAVHLMLTFNEGRVGGIVPTWFGLLAALVYSIGMALVLISALNADPTTLFSRRRRAERPRDWVRVHSILPAAVGTAILYFAQVVWFPDDINPDVVKENFFVAVLQFLPLVMITLGLEFNFARRGNDSRRASDTSPPLDPIRRAAPIVTMILLCLAMLLAFSTLMNDPNGGGVLASAWHEYVAFGVSVQATTIGLATVVWLLLAGSPD